MRESANQHRNYGVVWNLSLEELRKEILENRSLCYDLNERAKEALATMRWELLGKSMEYKQELPTFPPYEKELELPGSDGKQLISAAELHSNVPCPSAKNGFKMKCSKIVPRNLWEAERILQVRMKAALVLCRVQLAEKRRKDGYEFI